MQKREDLGDKETGGQHIKVMMGRGQPGGQQMRPNIPTTKTWNQHQPNIPAYNQVWPPPAPHLQGQGEFPPRVPMQWVKVPPMQQQRMTGFQQMPMNRPNINMHGPLRPGNQFNAQPQNQAGMPPRFNVVNAKPSGMHGQQVPQGQSADQGGWLQMSGAGAVAKLMSQHQLGTQNHQQFGTGHAPFSHGSIHTGQPPPMANVLRPVGPPHSHAKPNMDAAGNFWQHPPQNYPWANQRGADYSGRDAQMNRESSWTQSRSCYDNAAQGDFVPHDAPPNPQTDWKHIPPPKTTPAWPAPTHGGPNFNTGGHQTGGTPESFSNKAQGSVANDYMLGRAKSEMDTQQAMKTQKRQDTTLTQNIIGAGSGDEKSLNLTKLMMDARMWVEQRGYSLPALPQSNQSDSLKTQSFQNQIQMPEESVSSNLDTGNSGQEIKTTLTERGFVRTIVPKK